LVEELWRNRAIDRFADCLEIVILGSIVVDIGRAFTMMRCAAAVLVSLMGLSSCGTKGAEDERVAELETKVLELEVEVADLQEQVERLEEMVVEKESRKPYLDKSAVPFLKEYSEAKALVARCEEVEGRFLLDREEAVEVRSNFGGVWMSMRMIPAIADGEVTGIKVYGIRKDSFAGSCGFHNGDLVQEINGTKASFSDPVMDPLKLAEDIEEAGEARIQLIRHGEPMELVIGKSPGD
jgi:hypothetical protein